ncbi:IS110 family transposase [Bacteroidia bacterium]|nr:IS110 family transposase [Bacteroidia bacterium]GHT72051.1 IS110 family transposase [Bacteroidia bacterium]GHU90252.1 IS110 family transposase [Bacteroidia bacterium]GHV23840.1 IS110 family transposase [Bacteroidia bacterium]
MDKVCGLDVHKDSVFACILGANEEKIYEGRFGTTTSELTKLRNNLVEYGTGRVAMESTSIYWMPVWSVLQSDFELNLVQPYFIKQLPGRKTDVKDAHWIATCLQKGLIKGSFVPDSDLQQMRQYSRRYRYLSHCMVKVEQRMDNHLQRCNIRFSNYISNQGKNVSVRKIVKAIVAGEHDPAELCKKVHGRTVNRHGKQVITDSLDGVVLSADAAMLRQCMEELEFLETQQKQCIHHLEDLATIRFAGEISLLRTIPGIGLLSAICILSEIGADMSVFRTASQLIGWAGLRPRNEESAGKIMSRKTLHGNRYLRIILTEAAWAATHSKTGFMGYKYRQLVARKMASQKALMAIARKMLVVIFNVLSTKKPFDLTRNMPAIRQNA